jgi:glycyl-tRNA synthetase beta chain
LAIAEKMDTIVSSFAIGIIPSGSQDPYALRRQATGIIQTLLAKNWNIKLENLIELALDAVQNAKIGKKTKEELLQELVSFFKLRVKYMLQEKAVRYDLIDAVLSGEIGSVPSLVKRAEVLESNKNAEGFKESIEALSRVINISSKAEEKGEVDSSLFENEFEKALFNKYLSVNEELRKEVSEEAAFTLLISMKPEIDQYFEHTMVMADNQAIRINRLNQMAILAELIMQFANMNEIIVK